MKRTAIILLIIGILSAILISSRVFAVGMKVWSASGVDVFNGGSNYYAGCSPSYLISDGSGGVIALETSDRNGDYDIFAKRLTSSGEAMWSPSVLTVCGAVNGQENPTIIPDGAGGLIVAWQDRRGNDADIYAQRVNANGTVQWTTNGVTVCASLNDQLYPYLATDGSGGAVITWKDYRKFAEFVKKWGSSGGGEGQFVEPAGSIAISPSGHIFVPDYGSGRIQKFTSDGTFEAQWTGLSGPFGIAFDSSGNIYVAESSRCTIAKFTQDGTLEARWGSGGDGDGQFYYPYGIAVDTAGHVYVSDPLSQRIQKFTSSGTWEATWSSLVYGLASDNIGYIYGVGDYNVKKYNSSGTVISTIGNGGEWAHVAVDPSLNVFTCAPGFNAVYKFKNDGTYVGQWGKDGSGDREFHNPYGVAADAGYVYVMDSYNYRVQKFTNDINIPNIYAQRISSGGTPQWTANGVLVCGTPSEEINTRIISDGAGGAVIAWNDPRNGNMDVYAQRLNFDGNIQWPSGTPTTDGLAICTAANEQSFDTQGPISSIADGTGGAIIAWNDYRNNNWDVYAQRVNGSGAVQWAGNGVPVTTDPAGEGGTQIVTDGTGGAIISYTHDIGYSWFHSCARRINSSGVQQWANEVVVTPDQWNYGGYPMISDGAGGAFIGYKSGNSDNYGFTKFNGSGQVLWQQIHTTNAVFQWGGFNIGTLAIDGSGGAIGSFLTGFNPPSTSAQRIANVEMPTNMIGTAESTSTIRWGWKDNAINEDGYRLENQSHDVIFSMPADASTTLEAGLAINTQYTRHLNLYLLYGSAESSSFSRYTLLDAPQDTNLSYTVLATNELTMTVTAPANSSSGSTGCYFSCTTGTGQGGNDSSALTGTYTYKDTGLVPNTQYGYKVRYKNGNAVYTAYNPNQQLKYSKIQTTTGVTFGAISTNEIQAKPSGTFNNLTTNFSGVKTTNNTNSDTSGWVQNLSFWSSTGLSPNTQYGFKTKSRNADGEESTESAVINKYTMASLPSVPAVTAEYDATRNYHCDVSWTSGGAQSGYKVYRNGIAGSGTLVASGTATSTTDVNLSSNTPYTYYIYAYNGDSILNGYTTALDTTPPAAPTGLKTTNITANYAYSTWESPAGSPTSYTVSYGTNEAATNLGISVESTASHAWNDLMPATTYFWKVSATNINGTGAYSSIASFETNQLPPAVSVIQPNGGETITAESVYKIIYQILPQADDLYIKLSTNEGYSWDVTVTHEAWLHSGTCTYEWTVPNMISNECLISVEVHGPGGWGSDASNATFEIILHSSPYKTKVGSNEDWSWKNTHTGDLVPSGTLLDWQWRTWESGSGRKVPSGEAKDWIWGSE